MRTIRRFILGIFTILVVFGCRQKTAKDPGTKNMDSIQVVSDSKIEPDKIPKTDTSVIVNFFDHNKEGLILPGEYKKYSDKIEVIGRFSISKIEKLRIIQISESKHPQTTHADYCDWANYVKVIYRNDTLVLFGRNVLEITSNYDKLNLKSHKVELLIAEDFLMKTSDTDGLTGCDEYKNLIIKSDEDSFSFIEQPARENKSPYVHAVLYNNEGLGEEIKKVKINNDTIILSINEIYQDGTGTYKLNIYFDKDGWKSFDTDRNHRSE
jgi:hypothetical protein